LTNETIGHGGRICVKNRLLAAILLSHGLFAGELSATALAVVFPAFFFRFLSPSYKTIRL